jgi:MtN3 and saliva related transmembrane protein
MLHIHQLSSALIGFVTKDVLYRSKAGISHVPRRTFRRRVSYSGGIRAQDGNPMSLIDSIGYLAAALTTIAFIPQALHTWRLRSANGISLGMYVIFTLGVVLWLLYGVLLGAWPLIVSNAITLALALSILVMAIRYR